MAAIFYPMHHETRKALTVLRSGQNPYTAAEYLRRKADARDQYDALRLLPSDAVHVRDLLTGVCFAKNWGEVWNACGAPRIDNSQKAINWSVALFEQHAPSLSAHVKIRANLTRAAMNGDWVQVFEVLQEHHQRFGPTLWALRWLFLAAEESQGSRSRSELLDRFRQEDMGKAIPLFAGLLSLAVDNALPEDHCRATLREAIGGNGGYFYQFFELLFLEDHSGDWHAWQILEIAECFPLIDRYELFLRVTSIALGSGHSDAAKLGRAVVRIANFCPDRDILYLADCADTTRVLRFGDEANSMLNAWNAYLTNDYEGCYRLAEEISNKAPDLLAPHELLVKSAMYLNRVEQGSSVTPVAMLRHHLRSVFSKNEHTEDSLAFLNRFGSRFRIFSMTASLRALHAQHSSPSDGKWHRCAAYSMVIHGPRNFEYGFPVAANEGYLSRCVSASPESIALRFFHALAQGSATIQDTQFATIPEIRHYFFMGLAQARRGYQHEAKASLKRFCELQGSDSANPLSPFAMEEARRVLVDLYYLGGEITEMLRMMVQAYMDRVHSIRRLPIRRGFDACLENREQASKELEFPIIAYLASDEPHEITLALKRFMRAAGMAKPSELVSSDSLDRRTLAVLFLRVCSPEVIDSLPAMDSVEKVEAERVALLNWIPNGAPSLARAAETELLRVTQQAQLRDALQKIEGARIVLNISGLREAEQERFAAAYFRYAAQHELSSQVLSEALNLLRGRGAASVAALTKLDETRDAEFTAFVLAFREVRDAFVFSPHFGIEACLSGRIRHGFVVQHLLKPFVERKLAVRKDAPERAELEGYWADRVDSKVEALTPILISLTEEVASIAEEVKGVWIQSKTETRNPEGLFDYRFDENQLLHAFQRVRDASSLDTFLDAVFEILLERTRSSLDSMRRRINAELRSRLSQAVDRAVTKVSSLGDDINVSALRSDLVACGPETERSCLQLARWFQMADTTLMGDVAFELVARTAVGMVERLNPDFRGLHEVDVQAVFRLRGRYFTSLVHIIFFLLENAIRHSGAGKEHFRSRVLLRAEANQLSIQVENQAASESLAGDAAARILKKVAELKVALDPEKVIREGGTGFAKVIAAVRYEFKQPDPFVAAEAKGDRLLVTLKCELSGIAS